MVLAPGQFPAGDAARDRSGGARRALGRRPLGGRISPTGSARGDTILLLGTGLTAVDVALTLDATGYRGPDRRAVAARPRAARARPARADGGAARGSAADLRGDAAAGARAERGDRLAERGARAAHRHPGDLGRGERRRARAASSATCAPWWDVHRHKLAPAVGATIEAMQAAARLAVGGGQARLGRGGGRQGAGPLRGRAAATRWRRCGSARIVNCTGPEIDIVRAGEPLLDALLGAGPDPPRPAARRPRRRSASAARSMRTGGRRTASPRSARSPAAPSGRASRCPTSGSRPSASRRGSPIA